jgi:hypothetical protein
MLPVYQFFNSSTVTLGPQAPVSIDFFKSPINITVGVWVVNSASYSVEFTLDDIADPLRDPDDVGRWFQVDTLEMPQYISQTYRIDFPCTFVRVNIQALTGALEFKVIQALSPRA